MKKKHASRPVTLQLQPGAAKQTLPLGQAMGIAHNLIHIEEKTDHAKYILAQLLSQRPRDKRCRLLLVDAHLRETNFKAARVILQDILNADPRDLHALLSQAAVEAHYGRNDQAIELLERALKLKPGLPVALQRLGSVYARKGERETACEYYNKSIALIPNDPHTYYERASAGGGCLNDQELSHLNLLSKKTALSPQQRAAAGFTLAIHYRELKDRESEFEQLGQSNAIMAQVQPWNEEAISKKVGTIVEKLDGAFCNAARLATDPDARTPLLIVSMPRSGSTLMDRIVSSHSEVSSVGEASATANAVTQVANRRRMPVAPWLWGDAASFHTMLQEVHAEYLQCLAPYEVETPFYTEKSLSNSWLLGLELMMNPVARVIEVRRHPLDVCLSAYQIMFSAGNAASYDLRAMARYYQLYLDVMAHWKSVFPGRILTVNYEDLARNQEECTREVLDFCGLSWEESCLTFHEQAGSVGTASNWQVRQPMYTSSIDRWKPYAKFLKPAAEVLGIEA